MTNVTIIIPAENVAEVKSYYRDVLLFVEEDGVFLLPVGNSSIALQVMAVTQESMQRYPPKKNFPIFNCMVEKNFLSYCWMIYQNGGLFDEVCKCEEGYYARVRDPADNLFEISCASFDEDSAGFDVEEISKCLKLTFKRSQSCMKASPSVFIILPVDNCAEAKLYYRDVLSFKEMNGLLYLPVDNFAACIKLTKIDEQEEKFFPPERRYMSFSYALERNFLSHCLTMYKKGALFDTACELPGGYFARVYDPAGNQFEIFCESFDEDDDAVSSAEMPFFFRY
ncbi:hypothetical protein [Pseudoduganella umbonata]|uniref:Catechol 2,3-dioxygenase-like lactoylglutathione lyase family enzyme n=1 Tax=Pseudoduganella umbonata TaxID=864828 RepID=A0A4V1EDS4_9BURK|nr:hypothetical protein [Pseudoduganella umbonata]MBB3220373.1 catechol 2,3-dioxygenase-like lactoylglutathione lyase family enzyme [Pseudoduganella umbonata]QCP12091.1 hypothetical protein FCL38_17970 [Pseudoduganella umbonata]